VLQTDGRTDERHDDVNSRSYCVAVRSANARRYVDVFNYSALLNLLIVRLTDRSCLANYSSLYVCGISAASWVVKKVGREGRRLQFSHRQSQISNTPKLVFSFWILALHV